MSRKVKALMLNLNTIYNISFTKFFNKHKINMHVDQLNFIQPQRINFSFSDALN